MNKKFIYQDGEFKRITKEELKVIGEISYFCDENAGLFAICHRNGFCNKKCEHYSQIANKVAKSIFEKYFGDNFDISILKKILSNLILEVKIFLPNNIVLSKGLLLCIKICLISLVKNETILEFPLEIEDELFQ